ncbi:MAG: PadR family transcriptional regulator [Candidatus Bathyarchaeia archaeon]
MPGGCCRCGPFRVNIVPQGLLKPYLLRLLSEKPMHGFEMMEEIFQRTRGMWRPGPSAIYPTLTALEETGYIKAMEGQVRGEKTRRPYQITDKGREALKDYKNFRKEWVHGLTQLKEIWW